ncbi:heme peroxidase [Roridomyces roridus]|uniref:Peroxidase n=1 Tax=Roridomyces roridus TaxID=1738132 RepID=A0AAD7CKC8_9AGAR|nr:heme peroxidase [Roridomyces roridus]
MLRLTGVVLGLASMALGVAVFHWPDPMLDTLEDSLYVNHFSPASTFALNCTARDNSTIAAQWLRLAYHDMATHNATTGLGGMDGSIAFEYTRAQNIGPGMAESLIDFAVSPNQYVGMSDFIAMGAVNAVIGCGGGPVIPFRGGRKDATEAGPATVPEPQQDLASHIDSFKDQGFNETEMISLVACGHSFGGVRKVDFPLIVTEDVPTGIQTFASKIGFDNTVVTEYLSGSTENVLVVGSNVSTRSDLRIFSSDNNATMQRLASLDTFNQVCADLIGRMIDTVPSDVQLTEPIEPFDYKVTLDTMLFPQGGSLAFLTTLRIIENGKNQTVTLFWKERTGTFCPSEGCSISAFHVNTGVEASLLATLKGVQSFNQHSFNASIDLATSISHFWFEVGNNDGSAPIIVDNHGTNFTIDQDVLIFDPRRSSFTIAGEFMVVGVKTSSPVDVTAFVTTTGPIGGVNPIPMPSNTTISFTLDSAHPPADGYTFYTSDRLPNRYSSSTLHATIDGQAYSLWVPTLSALGV